MGQIEQIWSGNWQRRVYDKLEQHGFAQLGDYISARPGSTYAQLANELGEDVAPVQITRLHLLEAKRAGLLRDAARDATSANGCQRAGGASRQAKSATSRIF